jgi:uncharacterized protein YukE
MGIPGLPGPEDFVDGLNDLKHGINEGAGDLIDNTADAGSGFLHGLDNPVTDVVADGLDFSGNVAETGLDGINFITGIPLDTAQATLGQIGESVTGINDILSTTGDHANDILNGDVGIKDGFLDLGHDIGETYVETLENSYDNFLDSPLSPEQLAENYGENDFFDLTDEGKNLTDLLDSEGNQLFHPEESGGLHKLDADDLRDILAGQSGEPGATDPGGIDPGGIPGLPGIFGGIFGGGSGSSGAGSWQGMNVEAVKAAAQQLQQQAGRMRELVGKVDGELSTLVAAWHGKDASDFAQQWQGQYRPGVIRLAEVAEQMAQTATQHVNKQEATSNH